MYSAYTTIENKILLEINKFDALKSFLSPSFRNVDFCMNPDSQTLIYIQKQSS